MIAFRCPRCKIEMENPDSDAGTVVNCVECGQAITLPESATPLPALPPSRRASRDRKVRVVFAGPEFGILWLYAIGFGVAAVWLLFLYLSGNLGYTK